MKRAALHNLGCKVNAYETEAMQQLLENAGYKIVPFEEEADVYLINTCSVTNIADRKSRQMLHRARKNNPQAVVVAAGCYVQAAGEELLKDQAVDLIIGNDRKKDLISILQQFEMDRSQAACLSDVAHSEGYEQLTIRRLADHTRAYIKIQDGCNQFCSYCIIPYTRGRIRSRNSSDILNEVKGLAASGYREIVLTGIHLSSYGKDCLEEPVHTLVDLIELLHSVEGIARIRLGSLEPRIITEKLVRKLASLPKVCPHFHLSLQSGCDSVLMRMNRHYTCEEYEESCQIIRAIYDNPAITTDVITGFPGETREEFEATVRFIQRIQFYEMHVFPYSSRKGTKAAQMPGQIEQSVKSARSARLLALEKEMSLNWRKTHLGREEETLLEEVIHLDGAEYWMGHTPEYIKTIVPVEAGGKNCLVKGRMDSIIDEEFVYLAQN